MTKTVTITHHATKPEYQWEFVVPEGPTVLLREDALVRALSALKLQREDEIHKQVEALPNGGSQSVNADLEDRDVEQLVTLAVKSV
jgi:hypothetical protein